MKRLAILGVAVLLFASTTTIAVADDADPGSESTETTELSDAQKRKAQLLADYVVGEDAEKDEAEAAVDEIVALRTGSPAIGWGAMFKLLQLAKATDTTLDLLLAGDLEDGWAFGRHFKALDDDQKRRLDGTPTNLGQLKKQAKEPKSNQGKKP